MTLQPAELVVLGVFGLMVGSFLNVCISRLPAGASIATPSSRCPSCQTPIRWRDNVPVISYLALGGRCRSCRATISLRYPLVESATAITFLCQGWVVGWEVLLVSRLCFTALVVALCVTDLETFRLPNALTVPGIAAGVGFSLFSPPGPWASGLGLVLGGGVLLAIRWGWKRATGVDAMGLGDVKMLAMIGAFLGWQQVGVVLFLSTIAGAVLGVALAASGRGTMQTKLPFGVFLAIAGWIASLWGEALLTWYTGAFA